eukprot:6194611-Pleurochrysis_carterae.AAC.4
MIYCARNPHCASLHSTLRCDSFTVPRQTLCVLSCLHGRRVVRSRQIGRFFTRYKGFAHLRVTLAIDMLMSTSAYTCHFDLHRALCLFLLAFTFWKPIAHLLSTYHR